MSLLVSKIIIIIIKKSTKLKKRKKDNILSLPNFYQYITVIKLGLFYMQTKQ